MATSPTMFATAKAATTTGFASAARGHTTTATASTSSLKPSRWTDASRSESLLKNPNNQPTGGRQTPPFSKTKSYDRSSIWWQESPKSNSLPTSHKMTTLGCVNVETRHTRTVFFRVIATAMKLSRSKASGMVSCMFALDATELFNKSRLKSSGKKSNRSEGWRQLTPMHLKPGNLSPSQSQNAVAYSMARKNDQNSGCGHEHST